MGYKWNLHKLFRDERFTFAANRNDGTAAQI